MQQVEDAASIRVAPLEPGLWSAFEDLFGKQGACYGCWCMHFRNPPKVRRESDKARNKEQIRARVEVGPPPGVLALDGARAVGWMQIGPRADVPEWNNKGRASAPFQPADTADPSIWAVSCFFVRRGERGQGLTHRLVAGGLEFARRSGARLVEACPIDQSKDSGSLGLFVGSSRVFEKAGFQRIAERKPGRPLMRLALD